MACNTNNLNLATSGIACLSYVSRTQQLKFELLLLAAAVNKIDAAFTINWDTIRATALDVGGVCGAKTGPARARAARIVNSGLDTAGVATFACDSTINLELMRLYLMCVLISKIQP